MTGLTRDKGAVDNHITRLRFEAQRTKLSTTAVEVIVAVGIDALVDTIFRHDPPSPSEMEQAIDIVEDALMATHLTQAERGELVTSEALVRGLPNLMDDDAHSTREEVEDLFQRLASASLGNPSALADIPAGGRTAAALLILRECMHHLGYASVRIRAEQLT